MSSKTSTLVSITPKGYEAHHLITICVPVAQLDRAFACGAKGRRFESCRAYHEIKNKAKGLIFYFIILRQEMNRRFTHGRNRTERKFTFFLEVTPRGTLLCAAQNKFSCRASRTLPDIPKAAISIRGKQVLRSLCCLLYIML